MMQPSDNFYYEPLRIDPPYENQFKREAEERLERLECRIEKISKKLKDNKVEECVV